MMPNLRSQQRSSALTNLTESSPLHSILDHTLRKMLNLSIAKYMLLRRRRAGLATLPEQRHTCNRLAELPPTEPQGVCASGECQCSPLSRAGAVIYEAAT